MRAAGSRVGGRCREVSPAPRPGLCCPAGAAGASGDGGPAAPAAEKCGRGGRGKERGPVNNTLPSLLYYFQSFSHLPTSWRFRGVAAPAASSSLHPQTGPGFSQPFWGGGLAAEGGGGRGSVPGSSERATKCCLSFRAANHVLS